MKIKPKLTYMPRVRDDVRRCRQFLRRQRTSRPRKRISEVFDGLRRICSDPLLYPVRSINANTGVAFRRHNVAQFTIIYAYFTPLPSTPNGEVSIRAIVHASEADIWFGVSERGSSATRLALSRVGFASWLMACVRCASSPR